METELALIIRDTLGRENTAQIEQLASAVRWTRGGAYEMRVVGYRSQGIGVPYSTLSFIRGWTEPSLYGERLVLGAQFTGGDRPPRDTTRRDSVIAVHPFAADRDRFYRFSGGDTIAVLRTSLRAIPVVRIHVTPRLVDSTRFAAFDGDIQLDADRGQIVRMRGQFVVRGQSSGRQSLVRRMGGLVAVAYCDFVNAEVNGAYWLPASQRSEFQTSFFLIGRSRAVMRLVSQFSQYDVNDRGGDSTFNDGRRIAHITSWAPSDSVNSFDDWQTALGTATTSVTANDFDDIAPDAWRSTGGIRLDFMPTKFTNIVDYDRVGGLYTGLEGSLHMRSVVPGLSMGGRLGWAWTERTIRGAASVSLQRNPWIFGLRAERSLPSTNDFHRPFEAESGGLAAMLGSVDDFDYVDRRLALVSATRVLGSLDRAIVTLQLGAGDDRAEHARLTHGLFGSDAFRPNRAVTPGTYALSVLDVEVHPNVTGDFVEPGVGAKLHVEVGDGTIAWRRTELSLSARQSVGPVTMSLHADAGTVFGSPIPPQRLFELGGSGTLPGYEYKEFAGDRAALFRSFVSYTLPVWRTPRRLWRNLMMPGVAPGFAVGIQGGWTEMSSVASRTAVAALTPWSASPLSHGSDGIRATLGGGLTLFGGNAHLGFARPIDRAAPWRFVFGLGQDF